MNLPPHIEFYVTSAARVARGPSFHGVTRFFTLWLVAAGIWVSAAAADPTPLPGTAPLTIEGDLSVEMVEGIDRWLDQEQQRVHHWIGRDQKKWTFQDPSAEGVQKEHAAKREILRKMIGAVDPARVGPLEVHAEPGTAPLSVGAGAYTIERARWPVFDGVHGEGLLLRPRGPASAAVIALPDAAHTPEQFCGLQPGIEPEAQFARLLAERGALVLVMTLVDRRDTWSGNERLGRFTNQPHREWIYRQSFELGRTLIGYEVQKVLAAISSLRGPAANLLRENARIGVLGHGEGGRAALMSAALDPRIQAAYVSGFVGSSAKMWREPIDRNLMGFLREFGESNVAAMVWPRVLAVDDTDPPPFAGPAAHTGRPSTAAPGAIGGLDSSGWGMSSLLLKRPFGDSHTKPGDPAWLLSGGRPRDGGYLPYFRGGRLPEAPTRAELLAHFSGPTGLRLEAGTTHPLTEAFDPKHIDERQRRTVLELQEYSQRVFRDSERARKARPLWTKLKPGAEWDAVQTEARAEFWEKVIGKISTEYLPPNPRTREIHDREKWRGYDVMLDVHPDIFAWGVLLVPKDLKPGERRPVVVCQHGLEGLPEDTITDDQTSSAWKAYKGFAAQLADRGFIVYAPHNPYRGKEKFRWLQRKANPLGLSLFSFIIAQHDVTTRWLASLPFVDGERIGFYGLSYGGKTAMRVPAVLDRYCLSICSADFNEWVLKCVSDTHPSGYIYTPEWEIWEWDLAHTFNYAEMALLIAPRPFMVERGHEDGVGLDEHVGYEWAKVLRGYTKLGIADRAEIEWFDGPHTINGIGTFQFLHKWLRWPER